MWKKLLVVASAATVAFVVAKKVKTINEERALWHEATTSPEEIY
ncbi:DLW-39 family protein [Haloglycomyces albus]|nr:DLW-39 family protein [Haloglycomyces albus]